MSGSAPALQYPMVQQQKQAFFLNLPFLIKGQRYLICQKLASVLVEMGTREKNITEKNNS